MDKFEKANQLLAALKATGKCDKARVWSSTTGGQIVRVYTGHGSEFLTVEDNGTVTKCKVNMTWGHIIRDVLETVNA